MSQATKVIIHGAAGRMGKRLVALAAEDRELTVVAALDAAGHPLLGADAGAAAGVGPLGVPLLSELPADCQGDVVIDFSVPAGAARSIALCVEKRLPLVMATTGLEDEHRAALLQATKSIAVVWSPSMSTAVNLTMKLSELAGKTLAKIVDSGVDVEIIERHHRFKEDAPSGTALKFGEILAGAMGLSQHQHGREGRIGQRKPEEIGYHAVRTGDNPGEHTIVFGMLGETIELTVKASNRDCYAYGALAAAKFAAHKPAGLYGMPDVLGL